MLCEFQWDLRELDKYETSRQTTGMTDCGGRNKGTLTVRPKLRKRPSYTITLYKLMRIKEEEIYSLFL
jgi:hypothetical protein